MLRLEDLPVTMSIEEAGQILGLSRSSAYRAAERGELPTIRLSGRLYVPTPRLLTLLGCAVESHEDSEPVADAPLEAAAAV